MGNVCISKDTPSFEDCFNISIGRYEDLQGVFVPVGMTSLTWHIISGQVMNTEAIKL